MEYQKLGAFETLKTKLLSLLKSFNKNIFMIKNAFLQNDYIFKKDLYFYL